MSIASLAPRADFPLLAANPALHYLDSAATSQKPAAVLDALRHFYETSNANPHRGAYALSALATDAYHDARATIARFVGVADADCLIFTRGTTESMNLVASSWGGAHVGPGDEIVVSALEHHANFVPWQQLALRTGATLRIVELTATQTIDLDMLRDVVGARTKIVAITHVSNAVGSITPLHDVVRIVRARSAAVIVVDGAQAVPHLAVRFDALDVDFYAFSGHKLLGPMGIGVLVGRRALLEAMPPYQFGGDMIEWVRDTDSTWNVLPHKFEAGTPNAADAVALAAAVRYLDGLGMDKVRAHEIALLEAAEARVRALPGVTERCAELLAGRRASARSGHDSRSTRGLHPGRPSLRPAPHAAARCQRHGAGQLLRVQRWPRRGRAGRRARGGAAAVRDRRLSSVAPFTASIAAMYQDALLAHHRAPHNRRVIESPTTSGARKNPVCGDEITVMVSLDADTVCDVAFTGRSCSIGVDDDGRGAGAHGERCAGPGRRGRPHAASGRQRWRPRGCGARAVAGCPHTAARRRAVPRAPRLRHATLASVARSARRQTVRR